MRASITGRLHLLTEVDQCISTTKAKQETNGDEDKLYVSGKTAAAFEKQRIRYWMYFLTAKCWLLLEIRNWRVIHWTNKLS